MFPNKNNHFANMINPMQMAQGFGVMGGSNPTIGNRQMGFGINPQSMGQMGFNPFCINPGMMRAMMGMTQEQKNQYLRIQGYLTGKFMAEQLKKPKAVKSQNPAPVMVEGPAKGELNIKFNKRGYIINIKMDADEMVAILIDEYFKKSGTKTGNFMFNGKELKGNLTAKEAGILHNSNIFIIFQENKFQKTKNIKNYEDIIDKNLININFIGLIKNSKKNFNQIYFI